MTENEAIKILKKDSCYECAQGTDSPFSCEYGGCRVAKATRVAIKALEEVEQYRAIGTPEECRAAVEKQKIDKDLESHDEKHILKYCISLMRELVGKFEEWYEYVHGEDAIKELCEDEKFCYRMSYFNIVQELFLLATSHSGGTSTRAKCEQLCVDSSDEIEFSFGDDEE